jgi:hypothetical protein
MGAPAARKVSVPLLGAARSGVRAQPSGPVVFGGIGWRFEITSSECSY